ncbi:hypothetical protein DJICPGNB_02610 [Escherichia coli]|nr:hypothetical protein DJICPGNB_02610 [Escherichia coli]
MKTPAMAIPITLCLPVSVFATTLRLSTDVDLLVLDGKKVSSSLQRGADSIELDNGPHQLVFRVEKTIHLLMVSNNIRWWSILSNSSPGQFSPASSGETDGKLCSTIRAATLDRADGDATFDSGKAGYSRHYLNGKND